LNIETPPNVNRDLAVKNISKPQASGKSKDTREVGVSSSFPSRMNHYLSDHAESSAGTLLLTGNIQTDNIMFKN
jgi:hypothetical protein